MIDLLFLLIFSVIFYHFFSVSIIISAVVGLLIGLFFGGISLIIKLLPALFTVFAAPIIASIYFSWPLKLVTLSIISGSLFVGYLAGSLLSIVFLPFKLFGKIVDTVFSIFQK